MSKDYTYCTIDETCLHRRGCRRWIGNYTDKEREEMQSMIDGDTCLEDNGDDYTPYDLLDRFRFSDGSEMPNIKGGE